MHCYKGLRVCKCLCARVVIKDFVFPGVHEYAAVCIPSHNPEEGNVCVLKIISATTANVQISTYEGDNAFTLQPGQEHSQEFFGNLHPVAGIYMHLFFVAFLHFN